MFNKPDALPSKLRRRNQSRSAKESVHLADASHQRVHLLPLIRGLIPNLRRAQLRIAEVVVNDPEQFINQPISELARRAGVSAGAIVQFCKSLKLKGLPALKIALARELAEPVLAFDKERKDEGDSAYTLHRVFQEHVNSLNQTLLLNDATSLNAAAELLLKARRIVLFSIGLSYPVAYSLYARLRFIGFPAFIEYDSHLQLAAAAEMSKSEVAIGFSLSGSTSETVECLRVSHARNAKTICITNSVESPLTRSADVKLYAAPSEVKYFQAPLASRVSQLALADALLVILGQRRKQRAVTHLRRAEEHLLNRRLERIHKAD